MKSSALGQAHLEKLKKLFSNLEGGKSGFITFKMLEETWPQVFYIFNDLYLRILFLCLTRMNKFDLFFLRFVSSCRNSVSMDITCFFFSLGTQFVRIFDVFETS